MTDLVSVVVDREVLPGKKEEFEQALSNIIKASKDFPGYLGTDVHAPVDPSENRYRVIFRYKTIEELKNWENSKERLYWVEKIDKLIKEPTKLNVISGLETWFALPRAKSIVPPKRYKMAMITWIAITPLLIIFNLATDPIYGHLDRIPRILASTPLIVLLMTYLIMPYMAKLFSRWLYPK